MPTLQNLPTHAKHIFEGVMQSLAGKVNPRTGRIYTDEERGKIAWSAVKKKYKKTGQQWVAK